MNTLTDKNRVDTLLIRAKNGLKYCNNNWQLAKSLVDFNPNQYEVIMKRLDYSTGILRIIMTELNALDFQKCPFEVCKWNDDTFICFACSRGNNEN